MRILLLLVPSNVAANRTYSSNTSIIPPYVLTHLATDSTSDLACMLTLCALQICILMLSLSLFYGPRSLWRQSQMADLARPHLCEFERHGFWCDWKSFIKDYVWQRKSWAKSLMFWYMSWDIVNMHCDIIENYGQQA